MTLVVDASLATKWVVREEGTAEAWRFAARYGGNLHAPDLLHTEVLGVLVRLANQKTVSQEATLERVDWWTQAWEQGAFVGHRVTVTLARRAARLAVKLGHAIKDCVYLALAEELGVVLATCDVKFHDRVGDARRVQLLEKLL